jgi:hypothetical protein
MCVLTAPSTVPSQCVHYCALCTWSLQSDNIDHCARNVYHCARNVYLCARNVYLRALSTYGNIAMCALLRALSAISQYVNCCTLYAWRACCEACCLGILSFVTLAAWRCIGTHSLSTHSLSTHSQSKHSHFKHSRRRRSSLRLLPWMQSRG